MPTVRQDGRITNEALSRRRLEDATRANRLSWWDAGGSLAFRPGHALKLKIR